MEARELMIGDWVSSPRLRSHGGGNYFHKLQRIDLGCEYDPIPLTQDMLIANGFEGDILHKCGEYKINCVFGHSIYITLKGRSYSLPAPMYVHQLQHALRLCGLKELADNLNI